jgi:hypothetical protein
VSPLKNGNLVNTCKVLYSERAWSKCLKTIGILAVAENKSPDKTKARGDNPGY